MSLFAKKSKYPKLPEGDHEVVLRCSICNGEEVICLKDKESGELREIMLVSSPEDLEGFCEENGLNAGDIKKVY